MKSCPKNRRALAAASVFAFCALASEGCAPGILGARTSALSTRTYKRFVYTINYTTPDVGLYTVDASTGKVTFDSLQPLPAGTVAWGGAVTPNGKYFYVSDSQAGRDVIYAYSINAATGQLTYISTTPSGSPGVPEFMTTDPAGRFLYVPLPGDFIVPSKIGVFAIDAATGALTSVQSAAAGLGPINVAIDPAGRYAYAPSSSANAISVFSIHPVTGQLTAAGSIAAGSVPVYVTLSADGTRLFCANYGDQVAPTPGSLGAYSVNSATGALTFLNQVSAPANYYYYTVTAHPNGKTAYALNYELPNASLTAYSVQATSGQVTAGTVTPHSAGPTMLAFDDTGAYAYTSDYHNNGIAGSVSVYSVNASTGALTPLQSEVPESTGHGANAVIYAKVPQ